MIRLRVLTVKRIIGEMIDAEDRRVLAQALALLIVLTVGVITVAAAMGLAWNVFEFMRSL